jgi:D-sedoheptulose 7-phosphate isomerase
MHHELQRLAQRHPDLAPCLGDIESAFNALCSTFRMGAKLLVCGNGGSAADGAHIVGELMKGFERHRPVSAEMRERLAVVEHDRQIYLADQLQGALPAISLSSETALSTAISNDTAADMVFAQQVFGYARNGDTLMAISTSGNSTNVLNALHVAQALGLQTIGVTGRTGGAMRDLCQVSIRVPLDRTSDVQERQLPIYHSLCRMLEDEFFG